MTLKSLALTIGLTVIVFTASGCDDSAVRQLALTLRSSVAQDEKLIDDQITKQTAFYDAQSATIENSRSGNILFQLDAGRRMRSAQAATDISLDPNGEARLAKIMTYLLETHDKEFDNWNQLYEDNQEAREDLRSRIVKLERQKKVLTQIKKNLDQLAVKAGSKKRALLLLQFSRETYAKTKAAVNN